MQGHFSNQPRRWWRVVFALLMLITCIRVWVGAEPYPPSALAQIPDSGLQRKELLDEARRTNELLGEIKQLLKEHTLNVRIQGADKQPPPPARTGDGGL